jgi:UDP-N-acetylmuramoyl-L-alanyl-D-glutamate--2,6-diaminopimelate ligase
MEAPQITPISLRELIKRAALAVSIDIPSQVLVQGVTMDSRQVGRDTIFVACAGMQTDGHLFIPDAVKNGAVAVVGTKPLERIGVPYVLVADGRLAYARLSAALYDFPARKMTMIGVTGTDGKTTTTSLIYHILKAAGKRAGMISTVSAVIGDVSLDTGFHVTTPDAGDVQRYLAFMLEAGITHVVLEATSHGLAQGRVEACEFDVGVVTNITHEHLDFHGSYEAYRAAKARLFAMLAETAEKPGGNLRIAILNMDDQSFEYLAKEVRVPSITYGLSMETDFQAGEVVCDLEGTRFTVTSKDHHFWIESPLIGDYNVSNILAAVAVSVGCLGVEPSLAQTGVAALKAIPGRMERIDLGQNFIAIVDFAHTPNALKSALTAVRRLGTGKIIAVFGSAGLRDREKRRLMAETSIELADITILTAEDPRTESIHDILEEMACGANRRGGNEGESYWRIPDRREAIRFALRLAKPGDVVMCCGKGHEQSMCFGTTEYAWDDRIALQAALAEYLGLPGPVMPILPEIAYKISEK